MKVIKANIDGLLIIKPDVFGDDRGYLRYYKKSNSNNFIVDNRIKEKTSPEEIELLIKNI